MAYNAVSVGSITGKREHLFGVKTLSGGHCEDKYALDNSQVTDLINMEYSDSYLTSRCGTREIPGLSGKFHSKLSEPFFDKILIHCGTCIFAFDGKQIKTISSEVPDCDSVFLTMNACAYLYTFTRQVFEVSKELVCEKKQPYIPHVMTYSSVTATNYSTVEPINMMTNRIKCRFFDSRNSYTLTYNLPFEIDKTANIKIYYNGIHYSKLIVDITGTKSIQVHVSGFNLKSGDYIDIEFSISQENEKFKEYFAKIYEAKIAFSYGGTSGKGTRAFLTGCDKYPGWYCMSELKNPLYFPDNIAEVVGDQTEKVTAVGKRYEKLFFFTERHIYSMTYNFSQNTGASFTIAEINSPVSCTMPGSVQAIDNTLVFGDKTSGVYILQSTDIFDELNVKHLSDNITAGGDDGFAQAENFCSCDFDRKYYIFNGKYVFIWDYGATPYYSSGDHKKAEKRLSWYRMNIGEECIDLIPFGKTLAFIKGKDDASLYVFDRAQGSDIVSDTDGTTQSSDFLCSFITKEYDMDVTYSKKTLSCFSFDYIKKTDGGKLTLNFYGDGQKFFEISPELTKKSGKIKLKTPSFCAHKFSVGFEISEGVVGVSNLIFYSKVCERIKHNL